MSEFMCSNCGCVTGTKYDVHCGCWCHQPQEAED